MVISQLWSIEENWHQNIKFQADRIFVRNDLFEQVIKSCKATNIEFTMLKKNLAYVFMKKITMKKKS